MDIMYERCCGLNIRKKIIAACLICGNKRTHKSFGATIDELRKLTAWLVENNCQIVAMEGTGSYWKPVYNILELSGTDMELMVVDARHVKNVPGRKTDVEDAEWLSELLQYGLLRASFIPNRKQRELRELSRYRRSLIQERASEINRLRKMLEGGNSKLTGVDSEVTGYSARRLLDYLLHKEEPMPELETALDGLLSPIQKDLLFAVLDYIDDLTKRIARIDDIIREEVPEYEDARETLIQSKNQKS